MSDDTITTSAPSLADLSLTYPEADESITPQTISTEAAAFDPRTEIAVRIDPSSPREGHMIAGKLFRKGAWYRVPRDLGPTFYAARLHAGSVPIHHDQGARLFQITSDPAAFERALAADAERRAAERARATGDAAPSGSSVPGSAAAPLKA